MSADLSRTRLSAAQRQALLAGPTGWLACGFGAGLVPYAQGTMGSLVALLPWLALRHCVLPLYLSILLASFGVGVWACGRAGRCLGVDDHRALVWDEFLGQWIALLPLLHRPGWLGVGVAFLLFRAFDVAKPWPIGWLDRRLKGGLGVMLDDVAAGVLAALALALMLPLAGPWGF